MSKPPWWFWVAIGILLLVFTWQMWPIFTGEQKFGEAPTPPGYTKVGEDTSYKCDNGMLLWYDNYHRKSLPTTPDDGRCHAKI